MAEWQRCVSSRNDRSISPTICWRTSLLPHAYCPHTHTHTHTLCGLWQSFNLSLSPTVWKVASHLCKCPLLCGILVYYEDVFLSSHLFLYLPQYKASLTDSNTVEQTCSNSSHTASDTTYLRNRMKHDVYVWIFVSLLDRC